MIIILCPAVPLKHVDCARRVDTTDPGFMATAGDIMISRQGNKIKMLIGLYIGHKSEAVQEIEIPD